MSTVLATQGRVLGALVLRETRATFGTSQIGYLWAIITPAASTALLVVLFTLIGRHPPFGSSFALFFLTGMLVLQFFRKLAGSLMSAFEANRALLTYPPIKEADVVFARFLLISATYALIMIISFWGLIAFGLADYPASPESVLAAVAATALLGFGFGTTNAVIISLWDTWRHVEKVLTRPLFFISGIFFVPSNLPPQAISYLKWNPVLHAVEWMRNGFYSNYDSTVLDTSYLLGVGILLTFFGLAGERLFRKRRAQV